MIPKKEGATMLEEKEMRAMIEGKKENRKDEQRGVEVNTRKGCTEGWQGTRSGGYGV